MNDPNRSLPLMLEAVEELLELLELEKKQLLGGEELSAELLERLSLASASVGEIAALLRAQPPQPGPEARALKAKIEQRFVRAFRLSRENEGRLRVPVSEPQRKAQPAGPRPALGAIERQYRERMRLGSQPKAVIP
jgi:hypothetical protein